MRKVMHDKELLSMCMLFPVVVLLGLVLSSVTIFADDSATVTASITVPIACTMRGTGTEHVATLSPGTYSGASGSEYESGIGKTTLTAICNDDNGFAVYAIGYTGNEYGVTNLVGENTGGVITTKAYASGDSLSNWSMRLNKVTDSTVSYNPQNLSIINSFDSWSAVPSMYAKVAEYHANTGSSTTDTTMGAKMETTYAAFIAPNQPADTYVGQVKYTLVHPYNDLAPVNCRPEGTTISTITCMQDLHITNRDSVLASMTEGQQYTLYDKRDKKPYTMARLADGNIWMTQNLDLDIDSNTTYTNEDTDIGYAPTEGMYTSASWKPAYSTIKGDASAWWSSTIAPISYDPGELYFDEYYRDVQLFYFYIMALNMPGYQEYASEIVTMFPDDLQDFVTSCDALFVNCNEELLSENHQEIREIYRVGAYIGSCQSGTCSEDLYDTLSPEWRAYVNSCDATFENCDNSLAPSIYGDEGAVLTAGISQYHIGNYYNWTAALATNMSANMVSSGEAMEQSICPSGWTLPRGNEGEDSFYALLNQYNYVDNPTDLSSNTWWNEPLYLIPAGAITVSASGGSNGKSESGYYWSATSYSPNESYGLRFSNVGSTDLTTRLSREKGYSVRCVARPVEYIINGSGNVES